jgi:YidC/Oxa1 family membrane protein insertase
MKLTNERRALIAFLLSMVLFVAYDALYLGPRMKKANEKRRAAVEEAARIEAQTQPVDTTRAPSSPALESPPPGEQTVAAADSLSIGIEKRFIVASPLFELTLSSRGGEIVEARMLRYLTNGAPVELIPAGESWTGRRMLSTSLRSENGTLPLDGISFDVSSGQGDLDDGARIVLSGNSSAEVVFRAQTASGTIERIYRFRGDRYEFDTSIRASEAVLPGVHEVSWTLGPGIGPTEANVQDDQTSFKASVLLGEEFHREGPGAFGREHVKRYSGMLNFASVQTKYFLAAFYPPEPTRADVEMSGIKQTHRVSEVVTVPVKTAGSQVTQSMQVYLGPLEYKLVQATGVGLERNVEFGWSWIRPVSHAVLWSMQKLYHVIPNYGLVVIIISILTKVLFYRLTHKSFKSMKQMQDLQPRLQALKEKFGDDKRRLSEETMKLYREAGVNPLGGCLPMLLQMPVFIALFNVFRYTIELRGAPFVSWINDLSQQDVLFRLPFSIPFMGDAVSLLPLLMGAAMWAQSKLGQSPTGQTSAAIPPGFNTLLPIVFTVMFYKMPSGLVIYWIINTVMSVAQQYYIVKTHPSPPIAVVDETPKKSGRSKARR